MKNNTFGRVTRMAGGVGALGAALMTLEVAAMPAATAPGRQLPPAGTAPAEAPATMMADGYRLVWHDEFDKDGSLNPADWAYVMLSSRLCGVLFGTVPAKT